MGSGEQEKPWDHGIIGTSEPNGTTGPGEPGEPGEPGSQENPDNQGTQLFFFDRIRFLIIQ